MEEQYKINVWNLFREEFKNGEQVIIVHENCNLYGGKLVSYDNNVCLIGGNEFHWDEIVFIAHDGFPCRTLHTCLDNEQLDWVENTDSVILMRKLLSHKPKEKIITKTEYITHTRFRSSGFGCPFEIQEVQMQILNPPNCLEEDYEETLLCKSKDGAIGMLWGLEAEIIKFYA